MKRQAGTPVLHGIFLKPMLHAASDISDVGEAILEHPGSGFGAAHSGGAMNEVFGVLGKICS